MDSSVLALVAAHLNHPAGSDVSAAWLTALSSLGLVVLAVLGWVTRHTWRFGSRAMQFLDDWAGHPPRPGVEARPGVMARLQAVEDAAARAEAAASQVLAETKPNHGHSLRDVVHRTANDVADVKAEQAAMRAEQQAMRKRMEQLEQQRQKRDDGG